MRKYIGSWKPKPEGSTGAASSGATATGAIAAAAAGTAEELLIPVDSLWAALPEYRADEARTRRIKCGNEIKTPALPDGDYRVYSECGEFLMLGRAQGGVMKTVKSFFEV